jgi:TPR repeat protein
MKLLGKMTVTALGVIVLCGSVALWRLHKERADAVRLAQATNELRIKAEKGDAQSQYDLGNMYYHGEGVQQGYTEAARWYREAAEQGFAKGQYNLGYLFQYGQGVSQDYAEAAHWYRAASNQGYASAQVNLALLFYFGHGVPQDYAEAIRLYREAADQGDARGEDGLALMYYSGDGVKQDYAEAAHWYRMAADLGLARAQYALGTLYLSGRGVSENRVEANRWFYDAAEQGNPDARSVLGIGLSIVEEIEIAVLLFVGIFYLLNSFMALRRQLAIQMRIVLLVTGVLCVANAGLSWYGYTHYLIRLPFCGLNAFTLFKWLLEIIVVILFAYIVWPRKGLATVGAGVGRAG